MTLEWNTLHDGAELACGDHWTYLITSDDRNLVLTRWENSPLALHHEVAAQASRYAIQLGGAWDVFPDTIAGVTGHLKRSAQEYESGLDVTGYPAWWHSRGGH